MGLQVFKIGVDSLNPAHAWGDHEQWHQATRPAPSIGCCEILPLRKPHVGELFKSGIDTFDHVADQVNRLPGEVEWYGLGTIISHLYLEKTNDDGSLDVKMYGNHLIIANEFSDEKTYHLFKEETLDVPISRLTVNGNEFPYRVEGGLLILDVRLPADSSMEISIRYGD